MLSTLQRERKEEDEHCTELLFKWQNLGEHDKQKQEGKKETILISSAHRQVITLSDPLLLLIFDIFLPISDTICHPQLPFLMV